MAPPALVSERSLVLEIWQIFRAYWLFILPTIICVRFLVRKFVSPLRQYPGPLLASGSRLWKVWSTYKGKTEADHIALHAKYGPVVRIAPDELSLSTCAAARDLFTVGKGFHKTDFYGVFPPPENPDIFTETREDVHAVKKRYAVTPYSMASMQALSSWIEGTQSLLLGKLDGLAEKDGKCDLGNWLHWFAFDVLGEVAFSRKFGFLDAGFDIDGAIKTIDDSQWYNGIIGQIPFMDHFLRRNPLWQYIPFLATKNSLITKMALEEMGKRKQFGEKEIDRRDLLSQLMAAHEKKPEAFGEGDVFAVTHGAIFAGSDSTASTMQSFCYLILKHRPVYEKIMAEIDEAQAAGRLSENPTYAEALDLTYFQAALKEAMRVRPAVGLNITRLVPPGGAEVGGQRYPGGTRIAVNGWVLHRDPAVWGNDAETFRPERWLEGDAKGLERNLFQFGGGSHLCIGRNLALLEMNKLLPQLLRNYDFSLIRPQDTIKHHSTFFVVQTGLDVYISKRQKN